MQFSVSKENHYKRIEYLKTMIIRKALLMDAERIAQNNVTSALELENLILQKEEAEKGSIAVLTGKRNGFYLVIEINNEIIGQLFITEEWSDWRNKVIWWMHRVYIKKEYRNKGLFTKLLKELNKIAKKENVFALRLYALKDNEKALSIYKHLNFRNTPFLILQQGNEVTF
jgi:GNAT superfamily N-acetyltransferase